MSRIVRSALIQAKAEPDKKSMIDKHVSYIEQAAKQGVQITCLQEIFFGPYFCQIQDRKWYDTAETIPGPTTNLMCDLAKQYGMALVVPIYGKPAPASTTTHRY